METSLNTKGYRLSPHYHTTWENSPSARGGEGAFSSQAALYPFSHLPQHGKSHDVTSQRRAWLPSSCRHIMATKVLRFFMYNNAFLSPCPSPSLSVMKVADYVLFRLQVSKGLSSALLNTTLNKTAALICEHVLWTEQFLFSLYLILKATCKMGIFPPFFFSFFILQKPILWN